ncbi:hypothetical protein TELCIR_12327 [Teladorsagia circumcincta]|uniref:Endonuclease/exonuclease/phosphatase domain-containing protein n=1 Tax=Teladorsagia circumcincta TaxID=45464 RepID=A0A2G9U708_TELCI|nr:hypothetical protein TELCIR_12327 [Teladorsagia circumcincta]
MARFIVQGCGWETRWKGAKAREIGEGVKLYYNGEDTKRNGVAIAVAEALKDYVSLRRIRDRIMAVRIDTKERYWTVLSVHAPQNVCPVNEKDEFYMSLDDSIRAIPDSDYLAIASDLNGHVGSDRRGIHKEIEQFDKKIGH